MYIYTPTLKLAYLRIHTYRHTYLYKLCLGNARPDLLFLVKVETFKYEYV